MIGLVVRAGAGFAAGPNFLSNEMERGMAEGKLRPGRRLAPGMYGRAQMRSPRRDGWTDERRATFLEDLAENCNVSNACREAGLSTTTAYALRRRDEGFRQAWDEALCIGYDRLEQAMLHRATHGTPKPVFHAGKKVGVITQYSDATGLRLLQAHRDRVERARLRDEQGIDPDAVFDELKRRFAEMKAREGEE